MKIAVAYNDDLHLKPHLNETEKLGEAEVIDTAREIAEVLGAQLVAPPARRLDRRRLAGDFAFDPAESRAAEPAAVQPAGRQRYVRLVAVKDDISASLLELKKYDVIVNLCEGVLGHPDWEKNFALGLEMLGIAHTSCEPIALGICTDKKLVKRILLATGIATPRFWHAEEGGTWIVKPSREDAGIGIDAASIVSSTAEIEARVQYVEETYHQPALVEEFIDGRELNQAIYFATTGPVVLPPGEIVFDNGLASNERVVGWKAKWASGSREDRGTRNRTPAVIDNKTRDELKDICLRTASILGLSGYVRFDVRRSQAGQLFIVDINPNPDIGRGSGFRKALEAAGIAFADFLKAIIMAAAATHRP